MSHRELEQLIREALADLLVAVEREPGSRIESSVVTGRYLVELVKRWRSPGMTIEKCRKGALRALRKSLERDAGKRLEELLKEDEKESPK